MIAVTEVPALQVFWCIVVSILGIDLDRDVGVSVRSRKNQNSRKSLILFSKPVHLMKEPNRMEQLVSDVLCGDLGPVLEAVSSKNHLLLSSFSPDIAGASNSVFDTEWKVMTHSSPTKPAELTRGSQ